MADLVHVRETHREVPKLLDFASCGPNIPLPRASQHINLVGAPISLR
jgi:hypothetical protein